MHADQTHGINDLRVFYIKKKETIPVYADLPTKKYLLNNFKYCFVNYSKEYPATLKIKSINNKLTIKDGYKEILVKPIKVKHGNVNSICYVIGNKLAYISDVSEIFKRDFKYLKNLDYLVLDCLWINNHPSHLSLSESLKLINELNPKKAILTNLSPILDYDYLKKVLPKRVVPAFDGLTINL